MTRAGIVACAFVGALLLVPSAAGDQSYSDPAADATGGSPDLTAIRVVNDTAGLITFTAAATGIPSPDTELNLIIDSDRNLATGDPDGDEFWFYLDGSNAQSGGLRWNGSDWVDYVPASGRASFQNGVWSLSVNRSELGNTATFDFYLIAVKYSGNSVVGRDDAPDGTAVYTYTLTTGTTPPPPTPQPQPRTYQDAPKLPSRIRYVGTSIKHVRIGENLYETMKKLGAPRVVAVACWSSADWPSVVDSTGIDTAPSRLSGFWLRRQARWVHVSPKQCTDAQSLLTTRAINGQRAYALSTILHERIHAQGISPEAQTECYAVQLVYEFARELNFVHAKALRLEQLAVRKSRALAPRGYWDARRCMDGGQWDLYPEFRNLNY